MSFDPYYHWLGIPPAEQPPNHYRLLGVALFEANGEVIQEAADRQMAHIKTHKNGPHRDLSQRLLNELSAAKVCLLRPASRAAYDGQLQASQALRQQASVPSQAQPPNHPQRPADASEAEDLEAGQPPRSAMAWLAAVAGGVLVGLLLLGGLALFMGRPEAVPDTPPEVAADANNEEADEPVLAPIEAPGLVAEVFEGARFERLVETRIDPQVSFFWGAGAAAPGLPGDEFSLRWTGWLRPPAAGQYRFQLVSDEPARLWIDDQPLLTGAAEQGRVQSAAIGLEDRPYAIKLEYAENRGGAWVSFRWQPPGGVEEAVPTWALFQDQRAATEANVAGTAEKLRQLARQKPVNGRAPGLLGELFSDKAFSTLLERRVDRQLDFFWLADSTPAAATAQPLSTVPDVLYARWRGYLTPAEAGQYTLVLGVDDGAQIWIDGKVRLDGRRVGEPKRFEIPIVLKAERHTLRVDYFKQSQDGVLTLHWIPPDGVEQVIPAECFSHAVK
ncbi:MAG: PA14 domain-containing protein [Pirellulales bacterium]